MVTTGRGTVDWFKTGEGGRQGCMLSPYLLNSYAEYIMQNAGVGESKAGINCWEGASLVVQRLRMCLPMQGIWVQPLEDPGRSHMPKITAVTAAMKLKDAWSLEGKL